MSAHGSVEAVNKCAIRIDRVISSLECSAPEQSYLDSFKYSFYHRIIIAVFFFTHRWNDVVCFARSVQYA